MSELDSILKDLLVGGEDKKKEEKKEEKKEVIPETKAATLEDLHTPQMVLPEPKTQIETVKLPEPIATSKTETKPEPTKSKKDDVMEILGSKPQEKKEEKPKTNIILPEDVAKVLEEIPEPVEEETPPTKLVIMIYGDKGTGKTTTALSLPGEICVLSFDRKAAPIKANIYKGDPRIHVFDVTKYMVYYDQEKVTEFAAKTYDYTLAVLKYCAEKIQPDWIIIDGTEIFEQICEWTMRHRHDLKAFEGIKNLNLWKERRLLLRNIHNIALNIAKKGIVYTTYTQYEDLVVDGELVTRKEVPRWIDVIMFETDIVLKTDYDFRDKRFLVKVVTSKFDNILPTGKTYDVTNKPLGAQVKWPW